MLTPLARIALAGLLGLGLVGCGGGVGTLTGKVTYQGKPVTYGSVLVRCPDGSQRTGSIEADGAYTVLNVPTGPVKIAVDSPPPPDPATQTRREGRPGAKSQTAAPAVDRSKWVKLPDQYANPELSELTTTVTTGTTTFNIELK